MTAKTSTYPLRLPVSLKAAVQKLSLQDGTSINRRAGSDHEVFRRILNCEGGKKPLPGDEL